MNYGKKQASFDFWSFLALNFVIPIKTSELNTHQPLSIFPRRGYSGAAQRDFLCIVDLVPYQQGLATITKTSGSRNQQDLLGGFRSGDCAPVSLLLMGSARAQLRWLRCSTDRQIANKNDRTVAMRNAKLTDFSESSSLLFIVESRTAGKSRFPLISAKE